jgi:hypothetical protein
LLAPGASVAFRPAGDPSRVATLSVLAAGDAARASVEERCAIETKAAREGMRGPIVVVRLAAPPEAPGTEGRASARLGSERLLFALFPDLEKAWLDGKR